MSDFFYKHQKLFTWLLAIIFVISLIPIFVVAGFDAASGDDYNYGAASRLAFLSSGSVWAAIAAAGRTTVSIWYTWQGTWFDCFLFCLHPEVFSDSAYVIVPYIFVIMQIASFTYFSYHFIKRHFGLDGLFYLELSLIYMLFVFQLVPSQKSAFFWWVGSIHYAMPMCLALVGIVLGDKFLSSHKISDLVWLSIVAAVIGGATYPAALLLLLAVFLMWLAGFVLNKVRDKRNFLLFVPLVLELVGLAISMIAPGNAVRSASDIADGAAPTGGILSTIINSITFSVTDAATSFVGEKTFVVILFLSVIIVSFSPLKEAYKKDTENFQKTFAHPVLFILVVFLLNASIYAPRLYAGNHASSGYNNFNFWVFTLCKIAGLIYMEGFVIQWLAGKPGFRLSSILGISSQADKKGTSTGNLLLQFVVLFAIFGGIAFCGRHGVKTYTDFICLDYYLSGQASDYKEQMALQRYLMEEPGVDDVVVPEINNEQGPLMHMPIVADPSNVDNYMTRIFYGKASCRAIPRTEWMETYADKYQEFLNSKK
ncbi:MAG: hypothetical protein E7304_11320 [Butyrivibrio sp.]|jgi:hypothetical protein|uniref:hypothetical protein n=1 Tax=Butyrivibrio sp. TaxID=28121 RepID=UPI001ECD7D01|nr:hypothetical protein [Butyrivibrio sp.]MBE5841979.1 hypothetical protein [Butyrivibrio sp.]